MAATVDKDLLQCPKCHSYVAPTDFICSDCSEVLPRGMEERKFRARSLDRDRSEVLAAYEQQKLEVAHVPRWLRRLGTALDHANENPNVHRVVQWGSGVFGFLLAYEASDPLVRMAPLPPKLAGDLYIPLQLAAGLAAFVVVSSFIFAIFNNIVAGLRQVYGEERDSRVLQGTTSEQAARLKKK